MILDDALLPEIHSAATSGCWGARRRPSASRQVSRSDGRPAFPGLVVNGLKDQDARHLPLSAATISQLLFPPLPEHKAPSSSSSSLLPQTITQSLSTQNPIRDPRSSNQFAIRKVTTFTRSSSSFPLLHPLPALLLHHLTAFRKSVVKPNLKALPHASRVDRPEPPTFHHPKAGTRVSPGQQQVSILITALAALKSILRP